MCCFSPVIALTMIAPCRPTWNSTVEPAGRCFFHSSLPLHDHARPGFGVVRLVAHHQVDGLSRLAEVHLGVRRGSAAQATLAGKAQQRRIRRPSLHHDAWHERMTVLRSVRANGR